MARILDQLETLKPRVIAPSRRSVTDASEIGKERAYLLDLQERGVGTQAARGAGGRCGKQVAAEFHIKYPDWQGAVYIPNEVKRVYEQAQ